MAYKIIGTRELASYEEADRLYNELELQGFEYISVLTNTPSIGHFTVRWGNPVEESENAFQWEMRTLNEMYEQREAAADAEFTRTCERAGRASAARVASQEAGLTGRDAEVFEAGFCGISAKIVNPRAEGREPIFRAGRRAWGSKEGQRTWRVESVRARSELVKDAPCPIRHASFIANGEAF